MPSQEPSILSRTRWIINPVSGGHSGSYLASELKREYGEDFYRQQVFVLPEAGSDIPSGFLPSGSIAIVAGGDGTFSEIVAKAYDEGIEFAIFSLGTGNDLARYAGTRDLSRSLSPSLFVEALSRARAEKISIWELSGNGKEIFLPLCFCNYLSFGFDARVISFFDYMRKRYPVVPRLFGRFGNRILYGISALSCLRSPLQAVTRIKTADGLELKTKRHRSLFFANIPQVMGLGLSSRVSDPRDSKLECLELRSFFDFCRMVLKPAPSKSLASSGRYVIHDFALPLRLQKDGEVFKLYDSDELKIEQKGRFNLLLF